MSRDIADLFYEVFITRKTGQVDLDALAAATGLAYRTVHEYCTDDRKTIPVRVWRGAFLVSGDVRFKRELEPDGWELRPKDEAACPVLDAEGEAHNLIASVERTLTKLRKAKSANSAGGARITEAEARGILASLEGKNGLIPQLNTLVAAFGQEIQAGKKAGGK
jgi:hypothetical protein